MKNRVFEMQSELSREIVGLAMKVHRTLGCGFSETVYRNALCIELKSSGIAFQAHPVLKVLYEGQEVGVFQADIIIMGELIVELKAVEMLLTAHSAQLVNYLTAARIDNGLLINFGGARLEFRTKTRNYGNPPPPNLQT